jgi:hypothetical protein
LQCAVAWRGVERRTGIMTRRRATIPACIALCLLASPGGAQQPDSPLKSVAKTLGFATDVAPPADFVRQSRPSSEPDYMPIFQPPPEPAKKALGDKELKAVRGDLDSLEKTHDAIRQAFPPSAKAVAEQQAAQKAKEKAKTAAPAQ